MEYLLQISPQKPPLPEDLPVDLQVSQRSRLENAGLEEKKARILEAVFLASQDGRSIGRRSLAEQLGLPENQIRQLLKQLEQAGQVILQKGRGGIRPAKQKDW